MNPDLGPGIFSLTDFMRSVPDASEWTYEGADGGGTPVLSWKGVSTKLQSSNEYTVRFHVHGKSTSGAWTYGSAWIEGQTGVSINVNHLSYGQARIKAVADSFKDKIDADLGKSKDSKTK